MTQKSIKGLVSICVFLNEWSPGVLETLTNLQKQTYDSLEILILDSSQSISLSKNIFESICSADKRIKYYSVEYLADINQKIEFALNNTSGEFLCFCNKEAWFAPEYFHFLIKLLNDNSTSNYAFCNFHKISDDKNSFKNTVVSSSEEFRIYRNKFLFLRNIFFYLSNHDLISEILFFSIFRKHKFESVYLKYSLYKFESIGFMQFVVYNFLKSSYLSFIEEPLIFIKEIDYANFEYNLNKNQLTKRYSKKIINLNFSFGNKKRFSLSNTIFNRLTIFLIFIFKFGYQLLHFIVTKILSWVNLFPWKVSFYFSTIENRYSFHESQDKLKLSNVTLVAVSTRDTEEALKALFYSSKNIDYGKIKLIASYTPYCNDPKIQFYTIPKFKNVDDWCKFIVYDLHKFIDTEYALLVHADGFVVNATSWRDEFLNYDYIGAPWDIPNNDFTFRDITGKLIRVGNSVSIRSKKLLELPYQLGIPWVADHGSFNEDTFLCCTNRHILEKNSIRYAPIEVAKYFAHESMIPEIKNIIPFAFHKWGGTNKLYPNFFPKRRPNYFSIKIYIHIFRTILEAFKHRQSLR
jgi:hypothetical protein